MSQLSLLHGTKHKKWKKIKINKKLKTDKLRNIGKQSGESVESVLKKKKKATVGRYAEKVGLSLE